MVSFLDGVKKAVKAFDCFLISGAGDIFEGLAALPPGDPTFARNTTKALRRLRGCDPENDPVFPPPPFTGGQCPGVPYGARYTWTSQPGATPINYTPFFGQFNPQSRTLYGPLSFAGRVLGAGGICSEQLEGFLVNGFLSNGAPRQGLLARGGSTCLAPDSLDIITNLSFERLDDGDECGDGPIIFPPPGDINIDGDVIYNIDEGDDINVNIPFVFAPIYVDVSGNFKFPFTFNFGDVPFSGTFTVAPEVNVTINPPPAPRGTDSPVTDLPGPDDEIPVTPSTFAERVVGVVVQSTLVGEQQLTTIATEDIPQILAPRCGSVKFGYAIAGRSFWSPDIDVKDLNCFIPCPFSQGADTVAASPAPGVVLNYVPIFGAPLATVADLGSTPAP